MPRRERALTERDRLFTERLNALFATRLTPQGRPYANRTVAAATGISASYISDLRRGVAGIPAGHMVDALARFFEVDPAYLLGREDSGEAVPDDDAYRRALETPLVQDLALQIGAFGPEEWRHMAAILEHLAALQQLLAERRQRLQTGQEPPAEHRAG